MSEISQTKGYRLTKLLEVAHLLIKTGNAKSFIDANPEFIHKVIPSDFITLFDELIKEDVGIKDLKICSSKILNLFHKAINEYTSIKAKNDSILAVFEKNNAEMDKVLKTIVPVFKAFNKEVENTTLNNELTALFEKLEIFSQYYVVKENVLFPILEKFWTDYRCLKIMWSFHDDIRQNIKTILFELRNGIKNMKEFNRCIGDVFFNMQTIKFREEKILFPYILETISEEEINKMTPESVRLGLPYIQAKQATKKEDEIEMKNNKVNLGTGILTLDQIKLVFNHLPVDITYVDENDTVQFFSTPKKRIFPRTTAIIGRQVSNCHPPESVLVVEQIVESFKNGSKNQADFWIKMKGEYIMIQYFAVRDENNNYKGVIEVTQEISDIKAIEGEKRLLDW